MPRGWGYVGLPQERSQDQGDCKRPNPLLETLTAPLEQAAEVTLHKPPNLPTRIVAGVVRCVCTKQERGTWGSEGMTAMVSHGQSGHRTTAKQESRCPDGPMHKGS